MTGFVRSGRSLDADHEERCDVCVIGSGAGGAVVAAGLAAQGLDVVVVEAGTAVGRADFDMQESTAYARLYQERGLRASADKAIGILQGRSLGGGTTVNWTTCFRTPARILERWRSVHGVEGWDEASLEPHFQAVEQRLSIAEWPEALVNANNGALLRGGRALGMAVQPLRRNVRGCANGGYCGMGCPVDGKQAMHLTFLPDAVAAGARIYTDVEADRVEHDGKRATAVQCFALDEVRGRSTRRSLRILPKVVVSSAGALNTPMLFIRSELDVLGPVGERTFLHPVVVVAGRYEQVIGGWYGAPQSMASHAHVDRGPQRVGFFLEAAPVHPLLAAQAFGGFGHQEAEFMGQLDRTAVFIGLAVDGLHPDAPGGRVTRLRDGRMHLSYPVTPALIEAFRAAHGVMAQVHLAAGAREAVSLHVDPVRVGSAAELGRLDAAAYGAHKHAIFSAHQMGGCVMGADPQTSVVRSDLRHHQVQNLFVVDGSALPTALGVNPSETLYALGHRAVSWVAAAV